MAYDQAAFSVRGAAAVLNYPVDRVQESLRTLALGATGGSPVLALKRCHSIRKRSPNKVKRMRTAMAPTKMMKVDAAKPVTQEQQPQITASAAAVVELEDLGADYLEELLRGLSPTRPDLVPSLLVQLASCPALLSFFFAFLGLVANTSMFRSISRSGFPFVAAAASCSNMPTAPVKKQREVLSVPRGIKTSDPPGP
ncbi:hypothetical protein ACQ4PT_044618 [Festuca glaucescens]